MKSSDSNYKHKRKRGLTPGRIYDPFISIFYTNMLLVGTNNNAVDFDALLQSASTFTNGRKPRLKRSEIVKYENIERLSRAVDDPYWKEVLNKCARGKFPKKIRYDGTNIKYGDWQITLTGLEDKTVLEVLLYLFRHICKMYSERDRIAMAEMEAREVRKLIEAERVWTNVSRSKSRRNSYFRSYVEQKYSHLSKGIRDELLTQINVAYELGTIKSKDIEFDGRITNIEGIYADETGVKFHQIKPPKLKLIERKSKPIPVIYRHYDQWLKWLDEYKAYVARSARNCFAIYHAI